MINQSDLSHSVKNLPTRLVRQFKSKLKIIGFVGGIATSSIVAFAIPTKAAMQVQITPASPRLGDTISVVVTPDNPVSEENITVTSGTETIPAYKIAPNKYRAFVVTTPLEKAGKRTIKVTSGNETKNLLVQVGDRTFRVQRINLPPGKAGVSATEYELKRAAELKATRTPQKFWNGPFLKPNNGEIRTGYGVRRYYNGKFAKDYYHRGVDYAGAQGSAVIAPAAGRVVLVGTVSQGFRVHGNVIGVDHGQGVVSIFMHLSKIFVKEGDIVQPGQKIGAVGTTGASTGPHLHWGLYVNGKSIDPTAWRNIGFE
ncbi:M23 family metallopeptidase [Calothrix sp. PCC 6303]|uniref:M23 family metallopeptidase n=1 Tax=Calothrix sp. PCC 6303 TaxID=1170562 RepID=UPI0002A01336|nr:M23 family metallopeptidase [Calothrix sp. PCC 6303]AFY99523.1 Peptidase M23 [Calothrix sp. PCC 6303]